MYRLFSIVVLLCICQEAVRADSGGNFPGRGDREIWHRAALLGDQATKLQSQGNLEDAKKLFVKAITMYPYDASLHYNLGNCLHRQKEFDEAIQEYKAAIQIEPNYAQAHYALGTTFDAMRNYADAETSYRKAIRVRPDYEKALFNLGAVLLDRGKYDEARLMFVRSGKSPNSDPKKVNDALREVSEKEGIAKKKSRENNHG